MFARKALRPREVTPGVYLSLNLMRRGTNLEHIRYSLSPNYACRLYMKLMHLQQHIEAELCLTPQDYNFMLYLGEVYGFSNMFFTIGPQIFTNFMLKLI